MTDFQTKYPNLSAALSAAQSVVEAAAKSSQGHQYTYASREEIAATAKDAFAEAGLAFALMGPIAVYDNAIEWRARLFHEANEEVLEWPVVWPVKGGTKEVDKATGSAMTYAYKNALINVLNMPREPEESRSTRVDDRADPERGHAPVTAVSRRESAADKEARHRADRLDSVKKILRQCNCTTREDGDIVIHWVTGGDYSDFVSMQKDDKGPGNVLAALNEHNETGDTFDTMLAKATERAREEALR